MSYRPLVNEVLQQPERRSSLQERAQSLDSTYVSDEGFDSPALRHERRKLPRFLRVDQRVIFLWVLATLLVTFPLGYLLGKREATFHALSHNDEASSIGGVNASASSSATTGLVTSGTLTAVNRTKPDVKIYAIVPYGRRQFVDILDCYLRQNLAKNGGFLDQVIFFANNQQPEDSAWLDTFIAQDDVKDYYKRIDAQNATSVTGVFQEFWNLVKEPDAIYLKIDDDMLWIDKDAIPRVIHSLIAHPEASTVMANEIDSRRTPYIHFRADALHAFFPRPWTGMSGDKNNATRSNGWRVSDMPVLNANESSVAYVHDSNPAGPVQWFRAEDTPLNLFNSPLGAMCNQADTQMMRFFYQTWIETAQIHYSHFQTLEDGDLSRYYFGNAEGIWNMWYARYSIQVIALWGSTVLDNPIDAFDAKYGGDEEIITMYLPKILGKPAKVDTHALVSHFAHHDCRDGLLKYTDVLDRYRLYANEFVCSKENQKESFDP